MFIRESSLMALDRPRDGRRESSMYLNIGSIGTWAEAASFSSAVRAPFEVSELALASCVVKIVTASGGGGSMAARIATARRTDSGF